MKTLLLLISLHGQLDSAIYFHQKAYYMHIYSRDKTVPKYIRQRAEKYADSLDRAANRLDSLKNINK